MKSLTIYSAAEFKVLSDKRVAYEQWNQLSVSELLNIFSAVTRQLNFKFNSPYNLSRAKRNEMFKSVLEPVVNSIETMNDLNEQLRDDVNKFYNYVKQVQENDSSERNASIDNGVVETQQPTNIDSTMINKLNRLEFLMKKLEAMGIDMNAEENTTEAIEQVQEQVANM